MPTPVRSMPGFTTALPKATKPNGEIAGTLEVVSEKFGLPICGSPLAAKVRPSQPTP